MQVFIDGENLRHRLVSVLYGEHLLRDRDDMFNVDIRELVHGALGEVPESIRYYTTRIRQPHFEIPEMLTHKISNIQQSHRRWIAMLTNQDIKIVKAGNLKVKESNACYHCGRRTMVLQEKGVDVRLASEVVMAAVHDNVLDIVVLSSDADMIPALNIARRGGAHITYLAFAEEVNDSLVKIADKTITYDRKHIVNCFKGLRKHAQNQPEISESGPAHNEHGGQQGQENHHEDHQHDNH